MRRTDPLIVGGGPAGAATAITLAQGGARPLVLERSRAPADIVCGAFLGWDAVAGLKALGLDVWALGARPIRGVRLIAGQHRLERRLPGIAAGLSRKVLDAALLDKARSAGATIECGIAARRLEGGMLHLSDGRVLSADALFIATGKHILRGSPRERASGHHVGLRTALPGAADLDGWIELHLLDGGYAGILLQEDGCNNLCLSMAGERLRQSGSPEALMRQLALEAPALAARMADCEPQWTATAAVPYGWRAKSTAPGQFRVGDQAAVISSLAGDGIAIALASGRAAAEAWLGSGPSASANYQRRFAARARRPMLVADSLRHAAERPMLAQALLAGIGRVPGAVRLAATLTRVGH